MALPLLDGLSERRQRRQRRLGRGGVLAQRNAEARHCGIKLLCLKRLEFGHERLESPFALGQRLQLRVARE